MIVLSSFVIIFGGRLISQIKVFPRYRMMELWGMWSTPSLPLLPSPLWSGVVAPDRVLSIGQIELFDI